MTRWKPWIILVAALCPSIRVLAAGGLALNGGSVVVSGSAGVATTGDVAVASGTLQALGAAQFSVGGNWTLGSSGTFTCGQSTMLFLGDSTLSGTSRFYNLTAAVPGQTLTLPSGLTQTIAHTFTMTGALGTLSHLRSSSAGNFASLANLGSNSVSDVDVRDCNSYGGEVIDAGPHSVLVNTVNWSYGNTLLAPPPVTHVQGTPTGSSLSDPITYSWTAISTYADGSSIQSGIDPIYEVTRYADLATSLNGTVSAPYLLGNAYGPAAPVSSGAAYYGIRAVINNVKSDPFYVDNSPEPNYVYAASNGFGYALVPPPLQSPFAGLSSPYLYLSLATRVIPGDPGVLASALFQIQSRGGTAPSDYHFSQPGATLVLKRTGTIPLPQDGYPVQLSTNGSWQTIGTAAYSLSSDAFTFTVYQTGLYRVDGSASALGGGSLPALQSVHPRIFSPNGDGFNDVVHFDLNNPGQDPVSGEIFDAQAAKVADLEPSAVGLQWDGRGPGGRVVPGGVYVYQIHVGSKRVNGTVVVVK